MAYHFRKLKQTLRIIPSTKSIGFSTRVNEGDQTKNSLLDGSQAGVHCAVNKDLTTLSLGDGLTSSNVPAISVLLRSPSDSELMSHLQLAPDLRAASLPVVYRKALPSLLPKLSASGFLDEKDPIFSVVKSVNFTSDDILLHFPNSFRTGNSVICSLREQIPIDVLTQHTFRRLSHIPAPYPSVSPGPGSAVLNNDKAETLCTGDKGKQQTHVLYSSDSGTDSKQKGSGNSRDGPSPEQMQEAREKLEQMVRNLFKGNHNYDMLHKNVVMENNLFGDNKIAIGLTGYKFELLKLRIRIHAQLFSTSMDILSITALEQTGVIRIHWRLKGLPQIQNLKFWRLFQSQQGISKDDWEWVEAFSYFHIGKDGLVHKHRIDRMMPDNEGQPDLTEKLRGLLNPAKPLVN